MGTIYDAPQERKRITLVTCMLRITVFPSIHIYVTVAFYITDPQSAIRKSYSEVRKEQTELPLAETRTK